MTNKPTAHRAKGDEMMIPGVSRFEIEKQKASPLVEAEFAEKAIKAIEDCEKYLVKELGIENIRIPEVIIPN